jgi:hypothetical protein
MRDALEDWLGVRGAVDWSNVPTVQAPVVPLRDGHLHFIDTVVRSRDTLRANRLMTALNHVRLDATTNAHLDFQRLSDWQRIVLDTRDVCFRRQQAFAKDRKERYGFDEETQRRFEQCIEDAEAKHVPILGRTARVYFDILFFHPFVDGNARAAALTLDFMLSREQISLDEVRPLFMISRSPDLEGVHSYLRLLGMLIESTRRRRPH